MARSRVTRMVEQRIAASAEAMAQSIINGGAESFDIYRERCGFIRGLQEAIKILDEVEAEQE